MENLQLKATETQLSNIRKFLGHVVGCETIAESRQKICR